MNASNPVRAKDGLSLKTIAIGAGVLLTSLALLACIALVALTTLMNRATVRLDAAAQRVRSVESVRTALLMYGRESDLDYLGGGRSDKRRDAETRLLARLRDGRRGALDPTEAQLIDRAERDIHDYLDARRRVEAQHVELRDVLLSATGPLEQALRTLGRLADRDLAAAASAQRSAERWDAIGNTVGIAVGATLLISMVLIAAGLKRTVVSPLLQLSADIGRFTAAGEPQRHLTVAGLAELRRVARAFNEMVDRLAAHEVARQAFLAGVAHDLRNPLAALNMRVQVLEALGSRATEEDVRKTVKLLGRQLTNLNRMVGDFLDASQIEAGKLKLRLERCDLRAVAAEAVQLYQATASEHRLSLSVPDSPVMVSCDGVRIAQVLNNLLSNAIKYSSQGGEIVVSLTVEHDDAVLSVLDHGRGIAADELDRIFEPFRRSGPPREEVPGVGLGLALVRKIVEAHGGRIEVESAPGIGSTFTVRLPIRPAEHELSDAPTSLRC